MKELNAAITDVIVTKKINALPSHQLMKYG